MKSKIISFSMVLYWSFHVVHSTLITKISFSLVFSNIFFFHDHLYKYLVFFFRSVFRSFIESNYCVFSKYISFRFVRSFVLVSVFDYLWSWRENSVARHVDSILCVIFWLDYKFLKPPNWFSQYIYAKFNVFSRNSNLHVFDMGMFG